MRTRALFVPRVLRAVLFMVVSLALPGSRGAQRPSTAVAPAEGAETVFANQAPKVVLLVTRKSGEFHSLASGVILAADGYIGTNYHALEGADSVEIRFFSQPGNSVDYQTFNAVKLLYADSEHDIAILKVNANSLPFLACRAPSESPARVGQKIYAIGNPKGLSNTISEGIVSALRSLDNQDVIQHTAAISPGSSGGALVDSNGDLLGMNSWQLADAQNLNFAIPSKYLLEALSTARHATTALSFPSEKTDDRGKTTEGDQPGQAQPGAPKIDATSQPAVATLRSIAGVIKWCAETHSETDKWGKGPQEISRLVFTPPTNVVWDVAASESVRSPFTGYIQFSTHFYVWVPRETLDKYEHKHPGFHEGVDTEYRYEFDVGPEGLELTRVLDRDSKAGEANWSAWSAASIKATSGTCWDKIIRLGLHGEIPETLPKDQAEFDVYNEVLKDFSSGNFAKAITDLDIWRQKYPGSDFLRDEREGFYAWAYDGTNQPAKVLEKASHLMSKDLSVTFKHSPSTVVQVLSLLVENVLKLSGATPDQLAMGEKAAHELLDYLPTFYAADQKPADTSEGDWTKERTDLETVVKAALVALAEKEAAFR